MSEEMLISQCAGTMAGLKTGSLFPCLEDPERCVDCLAGRLRTQKEFPHEVGLFLGYPPEDVDGFIRFGAKGAKCVGTWKVYGDEAAAKRRFALYKKCTEVYGKSYRQFGSFDRLVVQGRRVGGAERA